MKILIVEDREQDRYLLQTLLQGFGHDVVTAAQGAEALEKARHDWPDIIVTDILMPVMDGFTLCRHWQQDKRLSRIPFVFYTASYTDPRDERFALSLGADRFITKPQDPVTLMESLQQLFETTDETLRKSPPKPAENSAVYLKEYNEVLIRKLEDKMAHLQAIVDTASNVIIEIAWDYKIQEFNPSAERLYNVGRETALGRNALELCFSPKDRTRVQDILGRIMAGGSQTVLETDIQTQGDRKCVLLWSFVGLTQQGVTDARHVIAVGTDITAIKDTHRQLRCLANALTSTEEHIRKEVGAFLHDSVCQSLALCKLMLEAERDQMHKSTEKLDTVTRIIAQTIGETRNLTLDLVPLTLYHEGLLPAIQEWLKGNLEDKHNITPQIDCRIADKDISDETKVFLFRAIKELGHNALKHSQASVFAVMIEPKGPYVSVTASDNGVGCDLSRLGQKSEKGTGLGLFSIRERTEYLGGEFAIESVPGQGTTIEFRVPMK